MLYLSHGNLSNMLYQLPNGRVIYLSIEDFLDLTEEDIQMLVASGHGAQPSHPFFGSVINKSAPKSQEDDYYDKDGLDYDPDDNEVDHQGPIDINNIPGEEPDY